MNKVEKAKRIKAWRKKNQERIKLYRASYYQNHKSEERETLKSWQKKNKDCMKIYRQRWREKRRDKVRSYLKDYRTKKRKEALGLFDLRCMLCSSRHNLVFISREGEVGGFIYSLVIKNPERFVLLCRLHSQRAKSILRRGYSWEEIMIKKNVFFAEI